MLLRVAKETISGYVVEAQGSWKHIIENYRIENYLLEPTVALEASGRPLEFSLSYIADYTRRFAIKDRLFTKIVDEVANGNGRLEWASAPATGVLQSASADLRRGMNGALLQHGPSVPREVDLEDIPSETNPRVKV
jgi:hypothetical protein